MSCVPKGWTHVKLADVGRWCGGGTPSKLEEAYWKGNIPWVSPKDMKVDVLQDAEDHISEAALTNSATQLVPSGSVFLVVRSGILSHSLPVATNSVPVALNQDMKACTPNHAVDVRFLTLGLRRFSQEILQTCQKDGTTVPSIKFDELKKFQIPLAPLPEQKRIVGMTEAQMVRSRAAREALADIPALLERYRQSVLLSAFKGDLTRGIREDEKPTKFAQSEEHPSSWRISKILNLLRQPLSNGRSVPTAESGFPVLRLTALKNGQVDLSERKIGAWTAKAAEPFLVEKGDFFVSRGNGSLHLVGIGGMVMEALDQVAFPDTFIRIRLTLDVDPSYFCFLWNSRIVRIQVERVAKTTAGIYKVNQSDIESFLVPVPPMEEQIQIVAQIQKRLDRIRAVEEYFEGVLESVNSLDQSILAKAFRGELVPQDSSEEPAEVLLARILQECEHQDPFTRRRGRSTPISVPASDPPPAPIRIGRKHLTEEVVPSWADREKGVELNALDPDALMASFRQALAAQRSWNTDEELLRVLAKRFGDQRMEPGTKKVLKTYLRAALLRRIAMRDVDGNLTLGLRALDAYTRDELIGFIPAVVRKGQTLKRDALMRAILHHLGFHRLTDSAQDALKSALNGAIRRGVLEAVGAEQVRRLS